MQSFLKPPQNLPQILRQTLPALLFQFLRDAVEALGDGTGDAGKGIAVAAQGNGGANHIFKTLSLQKRGDGFRDASAATVSQDKSHKTPPKPTTPVCGRVRMLPMTLLSFFVPFRHYPW